MALPVGTAYAIPITVNKSYVGGVLTNFLYQVNLTPYWSTITQYINLGNKTNIAVYDPSTDTTVAKVVSHALFTANNGLIIYFNGSTSTTVNKQYIVCFGKSLNDAENWGGSFGMTNYTDYWGFNESGSTSAYADRGSYHGTVTSNASLGGTSIWEKCVTNNGSGTGAVSFTNEVIGAGDRTFDFLCKVTSLGPSSAGRLFHNGMCHCLTALTRKINFSRNNGVNTAASADLVYNFGEWIHISITSTSTGVSNIYVNGTLSGTANQNAGTPAIGTNNLLMMNRVGLDRAFDGSFEEFGLTNSILPTTYIATRAKQMLSPQTFWTINGGYPITASNTQLSMSMGIGF